MDGTRTGSEHSTNCNTVAYLDVFEVINECVLIICKKGPLFIHFPFSELFELKVSRHMVTTILPPWSLYDWYVAYAWSTSYDTDPFSLAVVEATFYPSGQWLWLIGRAVASSIRVPRFESSHRLNLY